MKVASVHDSLAGDRSGPPSNKEVALETDPTRQRILAAMQRMFLGHPKHVPLGADAVSDLATEAAVGRHHLYQGHSDLRERFEYLRDRSGEKTAREVELQRILDRTKDELAQVRALQVRTREEVDNYRGAVENFARIINVLQAEFRQEQLKTERLHRRLQRFKEDVAESSVVIKMPNRHASGETAAD